jgi:hypothetical protein
MTGVFPEEHTRYTTDYTLTRVDGSGQLDYHLPDRYLADAGTSYCSRRRGKQK